MLKRVAAAGLLCVSAAAGFAGCSSGSPGNPSGSTANPMAGAALQQELSTLAGRIQGWQATHDGAPATSADLTDALGSGLPSGTIKVAYATNGSAFCLTAESMGMKSVWLSTTGGVQPSSVTQCPPGFTPVS